MNFTEPAAGRPRPTSMTRRMRSPLAVAAVVAIMLTGCTNDDNPKAPAPSATDSTTAEPRAAIPVTAMAEYDATGGMCTYGSCHTSFSVDTNGDYTATDGTTTHEGTLTEDQFADLTRITLTTDAATNPKAEVTCNAWTDGMDYSLSYEPANGRPVSVSTCTHDLTGVDLLAALLALHGPGNPIKN